MEKRALIALVISFIVFIGFGYVQQKFLPHPPPVTKPNEEQQAAAKKLPSPEPVKPPVSPPAAPPAGGHQPKDVIVDTPLYRAVFTEQGARVKSFRLKRFWDKLPFQKIADFSLWMFNIDIQKYRAGRRDHRSERNDPKQQPGNASFRNDLASRHRHHRP